MCVIDITRFHIVSVRACVLACVRECVCVGGVGGGVSGCFGDTSSS